MSCKLDTSVPKKKSALKLQVIFVGKILTESWLQCHSHGNAYPQQLLIFISKVHRAWHVW
jgi:hypothetical protein